MPNKKTYRANPYTAWVILLMLVVVVGFVVGDVVLNSGGKVVDFTTIAEAPPSDAALVFAFADDKGLLSPDIDRYLSTEIYTADQMKTIMLTESDPLFFCKQVGTTKECHRVDAWKAKEIYDEYERVQKGGN